MPAAMFGPQGDEPSEAEVIELETPMRLEANLPLSLQVESVDDQGNGTLGVTARRLGMKTVIEPPSYPGVPAPAGPMVMHQEFNLQTGEITFTMNGEKTAIPADSLPGAQVSPAAAMQAIKLQLSPRGKLLDVSGLDQAMQHATMNPMTMGMGMGMDPHQQMQNMLAQAPAMFPTCPLAPGDSWQVEMPLMVPGMTGCPDSYTWTFTLKGLGNIDGHRVARIGMQSDVDLSDMSLSSAMRGMQMPMGMVGPVPEIDTFIIASSGDLFWNLDEGFMHSARVAATMDMHMTIPASAGDTAEEGAGAAMSWPEMSYGVRDMTIRYNINPAS
jgi:hypothetical protein